MDQFRTCLTCGREATRELLLRFVVTPDGRVLPDVLGRAPGRGLYACPSAACVEGMGRSPRFRKATAGVHAVLDAPAAIAAAGAQIAARITSLLLLSRKAGRCAIGTDESLEMHRAGRAALVVVASDAAGRVGDFEGEAVVRPAGIDKRRLGALLGGKGGCAAVAMSDPGLARRLRDEVTRLDGIGPPPDGSEHRPDGATPPDGPGVGS